MKKINSKGFTLVELLAVIVIMGILMMVAIPSISRVIENSRKDTFVDVAKSYGNSARNLWVAEGLSCQTENGVSSPSGVPDGTYYVKISTDTDDNAPVLLDQGGKSSWGNRDMKGYVQVVVKTQKGIVGDLNEDGEINNPDMITCRSIVLDPEADAFDKKLCDANGDNSATAEDITAIRNYINAGGYSESNTSRIGKEVSEKTTKFYVVVSDNTHGVNVTSSGTANDELIVSDEIVRGNVVMDGAAWIETLPSNNVCIEA